MAEVDSVEERILLRSPGAGDAAAGVSAAAASARYGDDIFIFPLLEKPPPAPSALTPGATAAEEPVSADVTLGQGRHLLPTDGAFTTITYPVAPTASQPLRLPMLSFVRSPSLSAWCSGHGSGRQQVTLCLIETTVVHFSESGQDEVYA